MKKDKNKMELELLEPRIVRLKGGWQLVKHMEPHRDLEFLKKVAFLWPQLLNNHRIKYVIDHNYTPPSGEFYLWFTERFYNGVLKDVVEIRIQDLPNNPEGGIPSDSAIQPYEGWVLYKLENLEINSYQEGAIKDHYLSSNHPDLANKKFFRAEEGWANDEDYLKKERGEDVRNWSDWHQTHNPITYKLFYAWVKDTLLWYYIVPIYWELTEDTSGENTITLGGLSKRESS